MDLSQCEVEDAQDIDEIIDRATKNGSIAKQVRNIMMRVSLSFNVDSAWAED